MIRSHVGLALIALTSVLTVSGCSTYRAQEPTRMPVIYASHMGYTGSYHGSGYRYNGYKACHRVKAGSYHHGKYYHHASRYCDYRNTGYWGCVKYVPSFYPQNRTCSKWVWMPHSYHYNHHHIYK